MVNGGVGIGKNLNVGGNATIGGSMTIGGPLSLTDTTSSVSPTTGALKVSGGVGIGKQLYVAGLTNLGSKLNVTGITTLGSTLNANGQVIVTANPGGGSQSAFTDYPLLVKGSTQGIAIKVNGSRSNSNNYISFWDSDNGGTMWGRIEGQTAGDLASEGEYIYDQVIFGLEFIIATANVVMGGIDVAGASSSTTVCAGLGVCVTAPVPSLIIAAVAKLVIQIADLAVKIAEPIAYNAFKFSQIGVTYSSGSGDYAEYLLKTSPSETFQAGDIVGVTNGRISRITQGADRMMVISLKPIVLGNMPEAGKESLYEKVAFMGQVPVKVLGTVKSGDYILPSGYANGLGVAVSAANMKPEDYSRVVGIAWSDGTDPQLNVVNLAVGLGTSDAAGLVAKQESKITELQNQLQTLQSQVDRTNQQLAKLIPGFEVQGGQSTGTAVVPVPAPTGQVTVSSPEERTVVYFEVSRDQVLEGYALAEKMMKEKGIDVEKHPFFKQINTEPGYYDKFISEIETSINKAINEKAAIDAKSGSKVEIRSQKEQH